VRRNDIQFEESSSCSSREEAEANAQGAVDGLPEAGMIAMKGQEVSQAQSAEKSTSASEIPKQSHEEPSPEEGDGLVHEAKLNPPEFPEKLRALLPTSAPPQLPPEVIQSTLPPPCPRPPVVYRPPAPAPDLSLARPVSELPKPFFPKDKSLIPPPPVLPYVIPPLPKKPKALQTDRRSTHASRAHGPGSAAVAATRGKQGYRPTISQARPSKRKELAELRRGSNLMSVSRGRKQSTARGLRPLGGAALQKCDSQKMAEFCRRNQHILNQIRGALNHGLPGGAARAPEESSSASADLLQAPFRGNNDAAEESSGAECSSEESSSCSSEDSDRF